MKDWLLKRMLSSMAIEDTLKLIGLSLKTQSGIIANCVYIKIFVFDKLVAQWVVDDKIELHQKYKIKEKLNLTTKVNEED